MHLPDPRGPFTEALVAALADGDVAALPAAPRTSEDPLTDEDVQLALWICYELHYQGFDGVSDDLEWDPALLARRNDLERLLLEALHRDVVVPYSDAPVPDRLRALTDDDTGPGLSRFLQTTGTREQFREFAVHRSVYQLKEADPHTWAIPRLTWRAKAALMEIQRDEYGDGRPERMHSHLYRKLLRGLGLDDSYGYYVDAVPAVTLAVTNVMSAFGLRRGCRGALVGHLAAYEMTSSEPSRRLAKGLRRIGGDDATCDFFDVHVTADALHEQLAAHDLCGRLADAEPHLAEDILFGAAACLYVESRFAEHVMAKWDARLSSLRSARPADSLQMSAVS